MFMDTAGNVWIANEVRGEWEDGIWYSNTLFQPFLQGTATKAARTNYYGCGGGYNWEDNQKWDTCIVCNVQFQKKFMIDTGDGMVCRHCERYIEAENIESGISDDELDAEADKLLQAADAEALEIQAVLLAEEN